RLSEPGTDGRPMITPGLAAGHGPARAAGAHFTKPSRRRLLLVVTDGTSPCWQGPYRTLVESWAHAGTVGVISLASPHAAAGSGSPRRCSPTPAGEPRTVRPCRSR